MKTLFTLLLLSLLSLTSCAHMNSCLKTFDPVSGKLTYEITLHGATVFDANAALAKGFAGQGTNGPRVTLAGFSENASSTNLITILQLISQLAAQGAVAAAK